MMALQEFFAANPLVFHGIIIAISFAIMVKAANLLVFGINGYAKKFRLSDYFIGLLIVSLTASVPEFVSALSGLIEGDTGIIFGTILGSNIAGITLVLGILALVGRKIKLENKVLTKMEVVIFFTISLPFLLVVDGTLSRVDGAILIIVFFIYTVFLWKKESEMGHMRKNVKPRLVWKDSLIFILAFLAMLLSARWLVNSSIKSASILDIPTYLMAVVVLGIASSLPDIFVGIRSILDGDVGVGIGNALGSMIVKALLFLGIFALIKPLSVDINLIAVSIGVTIFSLAFVMYLSEKQEMNWKHGLLLIMVYIAYLLIEIFK